MHLSARQLIWYPEYYLVFRHEYTAAVRLHVHGTDTLEATGRYYMHEWHFIRIIMMLKGPVYAECKLSFIPSSACGPYGYSDSENTG
jgi:hypothetical protein